MEDYGRAKVSLRGASVKEITRDALLEKAALQRSIRNEARRSALAAQHIQRVWRGHRAVCEVSDKLRFEWDAYVRNECSSSQRGLPNQQFCDHVLRPFLYFCRPKKGRIDRNNGDIERFATCIRIFLQSIKSLDSCYNYCSWSIGTKEEHSIWYCQGQKLVNLCCAGLVECSTWDTPQLVMLASLVANLLVTITDSGLWNCIKNEESKRLAQSVVDRLLLWMAKENANFYKAIRISIIQNYSSNHDANSQSIQYYKEKLFVMASVVTVALRPLQVPNTHDGTHNGGRPVIRTDTMLEKFCSHIYTIPYISQRIPSAILSALQHPSVLTPCLEMLVVLNFDITYMPALDKSVCDPWQQYIPPSGWTLINVVSLARSAKQGHSIKFVKDLAVKSYVSAVSSLLDKLLQWAEKLREDQEKKNKDNKNMDDVSQNSVHSCCDFDITSGLSNEKDRLINELEPLYQQWHLQQLLDFIRESRTGTNLDSEPENIQSSYMLNLPDIAMLYLKLLNLFRFLHGSRILCPVLNVLAFAPGFLHKLWIWLDDTFELTKAYEMDAHMSKEYASSQKDGRLGGGLTTRWTVAISKIKGKASSSESGELDKESSKTYATDVSIWDIKSFKDGPGGLTNEALSILSLFCAAYGHLLIVLDDEEFYDRQVPFTLKQQRIIAASLNTIVYNGLFSSNKKQFMHLMEVAVKCLNSLYGRDCRRSFCHPSLWLSPAGKNHSPIPAAARAHEVAIASRRMGEFSQAPAIGYVLTTIPHVIPFEERVQVFREFVKSDKMARKMAGEIMGPGPGSIEICIRRDHLIEDAFSQLNSLGSRLKSGINVSFMNEHGLAEAGLDYGGLFKEFLTDLAKAAFDPGYGLFSQKETEEGRLFPHPAAANLQHGLPMVEFLGRIVGKAMYEGILLDYSFSHVFIWKLLGHYVFLDELSTLDLKLHQSLIYLKHYEGDVKDLALDFTVTEELFGKRTVVELISGGANISVTNENKLQYIYAMADYKLNKQMQPLINAFSRGLSDIISPSWLTLFNAGELNQLISGGEHDFDIDDLKANTKYTGGFTENSRTIKQFWEVLREFQPQERCALLKFVTSCPRAPLLGFKHLQPAFTVHKVNCDTTLWSMLGGQDVDRLPSASTCYNTLKLPSYKRMSTLRNKLRYAIHSNSGFELS